MGATAEPSAQITSVLDAARRLHNGEPGSSSSEAERREAFRTPFDHRVRIYILGPGGTVQCSFDAVARDIGRDGMAVQCLHMIHDGTRAWIEFDHPDNSTLVFFATVRYCIHEGMTTHRVGFEFGRAPANVEPLAA